MWCTSVAHSSGAIMQALRALPWRVSAVTNQDDFGISPSSLARATASALLCTPSFL